MPLFFVQVMTPKFICQATVLAESPEEALDKAKKVLHTHVHEFLNSRNEKAIELPESAFKVEDATMTLLGKDVLNFSWDMRHTT